MAIPALTDVGEKDLVLPPGIHPATLDEIQAAFVETSPKYRQRVEVWDKYLRFRALLAGLLPVQHEYLDGSFVTSRPAPKDTDVSFWVEASDLDALGQREETALSALMSEAIPTFNCDMYLVTRCAPGHPMHDEYQHWKQRTEDGWRAYKSRAKLIVPGVVKGYLEVVP